MLTGQAAEVVVGDAAAQLDGGPQHGAGAGLPPGAARVPHAFIAGLKDGT